MSPLAHVHVLTVPIAGYLYQDGARERLANLAYGTPLRLEREASNPFDKLAVRVCVEDQRLGFVPRGCNAAVASALDHEFAVKAVFIGQQEEGQPVMEITWDTPAVARE